MCPRYTHLFACNCVDKKAKNPGKPATYCTPAQTLAASEQGIVRALKLNRGLLFIVLIVVECGLAIAYGDHPRYRDAGVERATHEYVAHPTPENEAAVEAELERVYAPGRKWNRIVMSLLIVNSCLTAAVGYSLVRKK